MGKTRTRIRIRSGITSGIEGFLFFVAFFCFLERARNCKGTVLREA